MAVKSDFKYLRNQDTHDMMVQYLNYEPYYTYPCYCYTNIQWIYTLFSTSILGMSNTFAQKG